MIGATADADAPVAQEMIGGAWLPLVTTWGQDYVVNVITSVMQSTSMDDARVENCVVNAVRRWEFPKPTGGGIAIVLYPFSFTSPES
ncbi:MAG TPA: AgmX/PglI C-terminal domain-containing protein [Polyangia bacterium]|nr:AgmX/PglI C-terminal domain-containing protein [Polyangia bacterium]